MADVQVYPDSTDNSNSGYDYGSLLEYLIREKSPATSFNTPTDPDLYAAQSGAYRDLLGAITGQIGRQDQLNQYNQSQESRQQLLDLFGLAKPGGPDSESGFSEGSIFDRLLGGADSGSQGFSDLLAEQRQKMADTMAGLEGFGDSQRNSINTNFDNVANSTNANYERRGLGASNLSGLGQAQVAGQRQQALMNLDDSLIGRRTDLSNQLNRGIYDTQTGELERQNKKQLQGISTIGQIGSQLL